MTRKNVALHVGGAEAEVLIVPAGRLVVQIDVKELAGLPRLRDGVEEVQSGHLFVRDLRVHADQLGVRERRDEAQVRAGRRHVDVAARLVGLGLEREAISVLPVDGVLAEIVHRLAQALDGLVRAAAGIRFGSLASAPQHERLGAQLGAQIHRAHRLLHRVRTHARVVGSEGSVAEDRIVEEVHGRHRHDQVVLLARPREVTDDPVTLGGRGVDRHEIVVVEVHAPCADLAQERGGVDRRERRADGVAEGIAAAIADGPETERELVFRAWAVPIGHDVSAARGVARRKIRAHLPGDRKQAGCCRIRAEHEIDAARSGEAIPRSVKSQVNVVAISPQRDIILDRPPSP